LFTKNWYLIFVIMMRVTLILLLVAGLQWNTVQAKGGIGDFFSTICSQKGIDFQSFTNFFETTGVTLTTALNPNLYIDVFKWLYTPYHMGGKGERGIDCSNYVFKLMNDCQENYATSRQLAQLTDYIDPAQLEEGDLVFFNVHGSGISHVGVYLQNGKFTHASSSQGVVISDMKDPYWEKRFCRAGRLKTPLNNVETTTK
jgi:murein DD-endopeptidase / murein LD-carboxypeptidase